jgi:hypothetical protein
LFGLFSYLRTEKEKHSINPKFIIMENDKKLKKPFFANFLESQVPEKEMEQINGGTDVVTMKFPSDGEDGPGQVITSRVKDLYQTMKYPSDSDEEGVEL